MTDRVRVLHVIDRIGNAGAETLLPSLAAGIDRTRFELHVCGLRPRPGSVTLPALRALGVPVVVLEHRASYDLPALARLAGYIRRQRIDLIHTHLLGADIAGRLAGALTRRPVVSTIHSGRRDLDLEPRRRQVLERWTARLWCRRLVVVSDRLRDEIAAWFGVPPGRVAIIANGIDTERFRPDLAIDRAATRRALVGEADGPLVTNVARLVPAKGQEALLAAAGRVLAARPDARFLVVGEGPLRAELEARAAALGLDRRVIFAGFRDTVPAILAASDLFVLPSLHEGLPVALLEAMAAGCPVIGSDVDGVGQVIRHGVTGLLVPPAAPEALAEAILTLLGDPRLAGRLATAAREHVAGEYSQRSWARRWETLYLRELGRADTMP